MSDSSPGYPAPHSGSAVKTALVVGLLVALVASNVYLYLLLDRTRTDLSNMRESTAVEIANLRESSSVSTAATRRYAENLKEQLDEARRQASLSSSQAKAEAMARAEALAKRLAEVQAADRQRLAGELSEVRQAANTTNAKIADVSGEVGTVRSEVASTKSELEKTIAELKSVKGDLGIQSGLIATNAHELDALKKLGHRNYFEFKLGKTKQPQRIGDISLTLKRTDPKRNRYTVDLLADDKKTEKKDKGVNEPVQFYTSKARQPYELVVNQVGKDLIVGYLSTPREQIAR